MSNRFVSALGATVFLALCLPQGGWGQELTELLPGLSVRPVATDSGPYVVDRFEFESQKHAWPYGTGLGIRSSSGHVLWLLLHPGDYPPHQVHWADFDADGQQDAFFNAGFEEVFETHIYLNRIASDRFAVSNFATGFVDATVYAVVVDMDADGFPELLLPEAQTDRPEDQLNCTYYEDTAIRREAAAEYERLAGQFDALNFRYGVDTFPVFALQLDEKIRLFRLYGDARWVTHAFPEHLRWRIGMLRRMRAGQPPECAARLDSTIEYLMEALRSG